MEIIRQIAVGIVGLAVSFVNLIGAPVPQPPSLGATIATTSLSNTINEFRTQSNTNFENINTQLNTVSTTVSGLGNLSLENSPLAVGKGGTALTATPTNGQLPIGNSTGYTLGTLTASGTKTHIYNGVGTIAISADPADTSDNYTWTGVHTFTSLNTVTATSTSTSTDPFNLLPAGIIQMYASTSAPLGWLLANGSSYSTSSYPRLFNVIGYQYGGSAGSFNVPDFRNKSAFGFNTASSSFDSLGKMGGTASTTLIVPNLPDHTHADTRPGVAAQGLTSGNNINAGSLGASGHLADEFGSPTASSTPFTNLPPYITVNYIIKY